MDVVKTLRKDRYGSQPLLVNRGVKLVLVRYRIEIVTPASRQLHESEDIKYKPVNRYATANKGRIEKSHKKRGC